MIMANKHDTLLDYVKGMGKTAIDAEEFERKFKKDTGGNVKGWGRSINKNSDSSSADYTRNLLKKHKDLQDVMQYNKADGKYYINGARPGDNGGSKPRGNSSVGSGIGDAIGGVGNVIDGVGDLLTPSDGRSSLLGAFAIFLVLGDVLLIFRHK